MSFVPNNKEVVIGSRRKLKRDVRNVYGTIEKGSEVIVTGLGQRGYSIRDAESGQTSIECGFDLFEEENKA